MRYSEVANRYASALFEIAQESNQQNLFIEQLHGLKKVLSEDSEVSRYLQSPVAKVSEMKSALTEALEKGGVDKSIQNLVLLMAEKKRLGIFDELLLAFQDHADQANGVTRGTVRAAYELGPDERSQVEKMIKEKTGKNVILEYSKDPSVLGGVIAQVGSYTFDDTIDSHLRRMKEELNRGL